MRLVAGDSSKIRSASVASNVPWVVPALAAPVLWALSNLIDEHLIKNSVRDPMSLTLVTGLFASVPAVAVAVSGHWIWPGLETASLALLCGSLGLLVYYPYLTSLETESPSAVILMWNLTPVAIVGLARLFLHEHLASSEYFALALLVTSSIVAAVHLSPVGWMSRAFPWMVLASVLLAASSIIEKSIYDRLPFSAGIGWISLGAMLTTGAFWVVCVNSRRTLIRSLRSPLATLLVVNELLDLGAACALSLATSLGSVSLVHAVGGIQPIFVLLFGAVASRNLRRTRGEWVRTFIAAGLAITGLRLIQLRF